MSDYLFKQLHFVRNQTLNLVSGLDDPASETWIEGLGNHIKWNLGHIYYVQERFAFYFAGEDMKLPPHFIELYAPGTRPGNEQVPVPTLAELIGLLTEQMDRIENTLADRLKEEVAQPYTTSKGLRLTTIEEFLSFCLYHEGMHFEKIKTLLQLIPI